MDNEPESNEQQEKRDTPWFALFFFIGWPLIILFCIPPQLPTPPDNREVEREIQLAAAAIAAFSAALDTSHPAGVEPLDVAVRQVLEKQKTTAPQDAPPAPEVLPPRLETHPTLLLKPFQTYFLATQPPPYGARRVRRVVLYPPNAQIEPWCARISDNRGRL